MCIFVCTSTCLFRGTESLHRGQRPFYNFSPFLGAAELLKFTSLMYVKSLLQPMVKYPLIIY